MNLILIPVALPLAAAFLILLISDKTRYLKETLAATVSAVGALGAFLILAWALFSQQLELGVQWVGYGMDFALKADSLSSFILLAVSLFTFLTAIYSFSFEKKGNARWFYFNLLLTQAFAAGALLSDNMLALLFFWEGLLIFLYAFIALSKPDQASKKTAMKAFLVNAATGLCGLAGVTITTYIAGSMSMSEISMNKLTMDGWAAFGYALMLIGAVAKSGALPFHTWISDAAADSSAPFMAYVPAALDKLLGIYFLARISVSLFALDGAMQPVLMSLGAVTILLAAMMALVQSDYKRLLSYIAVSQSGYMILGIGALSPAGIAGGLFQMLSSAVCLSCLFMTAGAVERRTGTNDLSKLGGLFGVMPVTAVCFIIAAAAISAVAPLAGFFSKEMIYEGILSAGCTPFFIAAAELGSALTLGSFLKLGHSVFFGKRPEGLQGTTEAPFSALFPMAILAALCAVFGFGARIPVDFFLAPGLRDLKLAHEALLGGFRMNPLFWISIIVILTAVVNHMFGCAAAQGKACKASDHIYHAPVLKDVYALAQERFFDPYEQFMKLLPGIAAILYKADRFFDYLTGDLPTFAADAFSKTLQRFHTGSYPLYLALTIAGFIVYIFLTANYGGLK